MRLAAALRRRPRVPVAHQGMGPPDEFPFAAGRRIRLPHRERMVAARVLVERRRGDAEANLPSVVAGGLEQLGQQPVHDIGPAEFPPVAHAAPVLDRRRRSLAS